MCLPGQGGGEGGLRAFDRLLSEGEFFFAINLVTDSEAGDPGMREVKNLAVLLPPTSEPCNDKVLFHPE